MDEYIKKQDLIDLLIEEGILMRQHEFKIVEHIKPTHGSCCTCQTCGYYHDECVCSHNDLIKSINKLDHKKEKWDVIHDFLSWDGSGKMNNE